MIVSDATGMPVVLRSWQPADWAGTSALLEGFAVLYPGFDAWLKRTLGVGDQPKARTVVAVDAEGHIVGAAIYKPKADREKLATLYVSPEYRNRGIGTALLTWIIRDWRSRGVAQGYMTHRRGRKGGIVSLATSYGFKHIGTAIHKYGMGEHEDVYEWRDQADMATFDTPRVREGPVRRGQAL
ncbi:MAG: GNAT family N-acetyltransferase [Chloroflexi bacterium]|nr:GNAT family N-acetyltransferase [Chloroflexota bacterium]